MPDAEGRTPIHIAAGVGKIDVLEILLNVMPANIEDISYDENDPDILHQLVPIHNPQLPVIVQNDLSTDNTIVPMNDSANLNTPVPEITSTHTTRSGRISKQPGYLKDFVTK